MLIPVADNDDEVILKLQRREKNLEELVTL